MTSSAPDDGMLAPTGVKIFVAVCDEARDGYEAAHGLALLLNMGGPPYLLFDTGPNPEVLKKNLLSAGVSLDEIAAVVISHGHYDHSGGLLAFKNATHSPRIYCGAGFPVPHRKVVGNGTEYIGTPVDATTGMAFRLVTSFRQLRPGVYVIANIRRLFDFERTTDNFCLDHDGVIPDNFTDEIALAIEVGPGLVVLSGCAHRGICNLLDEVCEHLPGMPIMCVVGGFHLVGSEPSRIQGTVEFFSRIGVGSVIAGHCTGEAAMLAFDLEFGDQFKRLKAGTTLEFRGE